MQLYRGLPVITNQIPVEERNGIPHHLIGCVELDEDPWRIGKFKREGLRLIQNIHSRGKLPILVGGTHYYTQTVLFNQPPVGKSQDPLLNENDSAGEENTGAKWPILDGPTEAVLEKLREVDPVMADRWHPNETRKIRRSLEVYFQTGRPASEIYAEQKRLKAEAFDSEDAGAGKLRFPTAVFWVHAEKEVLNARLDTRVNDMVAQGLIAEARQMSDYINTKRAQGATIDERRGVWISIGFKEMAPYLSALAGGTMNEGELEDVKQSCFKSVKTATRQYAVSQIKWIRNKLWTALSDAGMKDRLYLLDTSNVEDWGKNITQPSENLVQRLLNGETLPNPKGLSELARTTLGEKEADAEERGQDVIRTIFCDVCHRTMSSEQQWNIHLKSSAHRKVLRSAAKRANRDEYLRRREEENSQNEANG